LSNATSHGSLFQTRSRLMGFGLVCWGLAALPGCEGAGPRTYAVSGTVTLDGRPLDDADVYLFPLDPNVSADAGKVKGGKFAFRAKAGRKRVEIHASRVVPGQKTPMGGPVKEESLPPRYNKASTLTADVRPGGDNRFTFALHCGPD
jgi:hypothetical protein